MNATTDSLQQCGARYVPEIAGNSRLASRHRYLLARELAESKTVLNIACSDGSGADLLATVAHSVIGVDPDPDLIQRAAQRYRRSNLAFRSGAGIAIPAIDASIDLVVSFDTLEYEIHHSRMMAEIRRVLAPGGVVILSTAEHHATATAQARNPLHIGALTRDELDRLLHAHFPYVSFVGQRLQVGSVVGPLNGDGYSRFITFRDGEYDVERMAGLEAPEQVIALASAAPLPAVPIGVMDGAADPNELASISPPVVSSASDTVDAMVRRLADFARRHQRDRQRLIRYRETTADLHAAIDRHRAEALAAADLARLGETRIGELERAQRAMQVEIEHERSRLREESEADRIRWNARERDLLGQIDRMSSVVTAREGAIEVIERSRSWRLTRPLRDLRGLLFRLVRIR